VVLRLEEDKRVGRFWVRVFRGIVRVWLLANGWRIVREVPNLSEELRLLVCQGPIIGASFQGCVFGRSAGFLSGIIDYRGSHGAVDCLYAASWP
jgi:hypothetical protein